MRYVDGTGLLAVGCASRALHAASEDGHLWHAVCAREGVYRGESSLEVESCKAQLRLLAMNAYLWHSLCGDIVVTSPPIVGTVRFAVQLRCPAKAVYLCARRLVYNWREHEPMACTNLRECTQFTHPFTHTHYRRYQLRSLYARSHTQQWALVLCEQNVY
jgi:hypothetical protein